MKMAPQRPAVIPHKVWRVGTGTAINLDEAGKGPGKVSEGDADRGAVADEQPCAGAGAVVAVVLYKVDW